MLLAASVVFSYYTIWVILLVRERQQAYDMITKDIPSISHFLTPQAKFIISFHRVNGQ